MRGATPDLTSEYAAFAGGSPQTSPLHLSDHEVEGFTVDHDRQRLHDLAVTLTQAGADQDEYVNVVIEAERQLNT